MSSSPSPTKVSLVLADVDGTLVTHEKVLTARAKGAVEKLHQRGILFAITSGRPPRGMRMFIDDLHLATPIAGFNGGVFVNPDLSVIESHFIPRDAAEHALACIRKKGLEAWLYTDTEWYVPDPKGPHVARETWTVKFDAKIAADFTPFLDRAVKIVGVSDDEEKVKAAEAEVQQSLEGQVAAARSQPYYLDVTHLSATKGGVVDFLSRRLQIPASEFATFGDMPNDVSMFLKSGVSVAMGNASEEVQQQARFVSTSCDDEGFARAVEKYVLGENTD